MFMLFYQEGYISCAFFISVFEGIYQQFMGGAFELENCFSSEVILFITSSHDDRNFSMLSLSKGMCALSLQLNICIYGPSKKQNTYITNYIINAIENKIHQFVLYV